MPLYIINYHSKKYGFIGKTVKPFRIEEKLNAFVEQEKKKLSEKTGTDITAEIMKW